MDRNLDGYQQVGLSSAAIAAIDRPIERANGLPNVAYLSTDFLHLEFERLFAPGWACVAFASEAPRPGDVKPFVFLGVPLILVRDKMGELRVFHNVCSHRGLRLVERPCSKLKIIRCPYHSWSYDLAGALRATPSIGGPGKNQVDGFDPGQAGLRSVRAAVWHDLIFVNISGTAVPFEKFVKPLEERWRAYDLSRFASYTSGPAFEITLAANWKLAIENTSESYHLPWVHPGLNSVSRLEDHYHIVADSFCGQGSRAYAPPPDEARLPRLNGISDAEAQNAEYVTLFPNVHIGVHSDQMFAMIVEPLAPDLTRERIGLYYVGEGASSEAFAERRVENARWWNEVFVEDQGVVEGMQRGRQSPAFLGGRFSPVMDLPTHHFHRWVARRAGSDGHAARLGVLAAAPDAVSTR